MKSSNKIISEQLEVIYTALKSFKEGATLEDLMTTAGLKLELRTFQRRLATMKDQGVIRISGDTRSTRYHLAAYYASPIISRPLEDKEQTWSVVPLSNQGKEILSLVSRPELHRIPVSYNRGFLEKYRPNVDSYLSKTEKQKLSEIGNTVHANQPAGTYAREILQRLLIDLSWNSSRLEGNTYSLLETETLIAHGSVANNKTARESQMILNHKDAIEFLVQSPDDIGINRYTILNLHALLSDNLLPVASASGRLRQAAVGIYQSVYIPLAIPQQIEDMFELLLEKAGKIHDPFEQAFFIMVQLPYLQPFDDVNKRVSRLAMNIPLNRRNFAPLSFVEVPQDIYIQGMLGVYELNRIDLIKDVFLWAYERSCLRYAAIRQSLGEPDAFLLRYRNNIKSLVGVIVSQQIPRSDAAIKIRAEAAKLPHADQQKFIESVETELMSLHEGNFARYWIRPSAFQAWKEAWS